MKKVLLITESLGSGGAERQICGLSVFLTVRGYTCRLITYVENQFYEAYLREHEVDYKFVPQLWNQNTRVWRLCKYIKSFKPDVVISFLPSVNISVCLARLFTKFKLIVSERNNNTCITRRDRILFNLYRMADYVVPNSKNQGEFIKNNFPFLADKVKPIINYVDVDKFVPPVAKTDNDVIRIVTAARVTHQKNSLTFLDAVKIIKDKGLKVSFDWFGNMTDKKYVGAVLQKIKQLDISDYITFHEPCLNIVEEYQSSDVFCLPSIYEGYPNVVVEAMCCGLPIACSNVFDNKYIVKDGVNGFLFDPEKPLEIAKALETLITISSEERKQMGLRNRKSRLEVNSIKKFTESYIELIEK